MSPLLALMRDQIAAAERAGLRAATINSTNVDDWARGARRAARRPRSTCCWSRRSGWPTRGSPPSCPTCSARCGLLVIDEAHCVSDWGFDFRPDYQRLTRTLLRLAPDTPVLATTATANERVTADVAAQLGPDTVTLRGSLARASLRLAVVPGLSPLERYAWVADALRHAARAPGIVYVLTVAETERVAGFLRRAGSSTSRRTRGRRQNREELEDRLRRNEVKALVATSALGMGYDKPDLAFCLHLGSPASPVAYYQQVGRAGPGAGRRAGRAGARPSPTSGSGSTSPPPASPTDEQVERILDALADGAAERCPRSRRRPASAAAGWRRC